MLKHEVSDAQRSVDLVIVELLVLEVMAVQLCRYQLLLAAGAGDGAEWRENGVSRGGVFAAICLHQDRGHDREVPPFDLGTDRPKGFFCRHVSLLRCVGMLCEKWGNDRSTNHQFPAVCASDSPHRFVNIVKAHAPLMGSRENERPSIYNEAFDAGGDPDIGGLHQRALTSPDALA